MKNPKDTVAAKQVKKVLLGRVLVVGLAVLLQFCWLFFLVYQFSIQYSFINILVQIVGAVVVLYIINQWSNPAYKLVWTFVILIFPILGLLIYFVFGRSVLTKTTREDMERVHCEVCQFLPENKDLEHKIYQESRSVASQSKYISDWSDFPVYTNTEVTYYKCGEEMFPDMLKDLERAEHFIFLEYFIIAEGNMFGQVLEILKK